MDMTPLLVVRNSLRSAQHRADLPSAATAHGDHGVACGTNKARKAQKAIPTFVHASLNLSFFLSNYLSIGLSDYFSVCLSVYRLICLSVSISLSIFLFISR